MHTLFFRLFFIIFSVFILSNCSFFYALIENDSNQIKDSAPNIKLNKNKIVDAIPRVEQKSRRGNPRSYEQFGITYKVMKSSAGFKQKGEASWYGTKFHGNETSNGERYNMYHMTAAHKTLPLPTYLKVTNLENGLKVIVRVNDRGPFHPGRIIDLSYAAATKLDILKRGTAKVEIEAIDPKTWKKNESKVKLKSNKNQNLFLQAGAFKNQESAYTLERDISDILMDEDIMMKVFVKKFDDGINRVLIGPFLTKDDALFIKNHITMKPFGKLLFVTD